MPEKGQAKKEGRTNCIYEDNSQWIVKIFWVVYIFMLVSGDIFEILYFGGR